MEGISPSRRAAGTPRTREDACFLIGGCFEWQTPVPVQRPKTRPLLSRSSRRAADSAPARGRSDGQRDDERRPALLPLLLLPLLDGWMLMDVGGWMDVDGC
eukprot:scaffold760_cov372-Prasinococcus_capsulatus_cf.AAC.2